MRVLTILLLSALEACSLQDRNMSSVRLGKVRLLEELRSNSISQQKASPGGGENVIHIHFEFLHYQVLLVDERKQSVTSMGYLSMSWQDSDLAWDPSEYDGVDRVSVSYDDIWHPTLIVSNAADPDCVTIERADSMSLTSDGQITYSTPVSLETICNIDVTHYPFDIQTCDILFLPNIYDANYTITASLIKNVHGENITGEWIVHARNITIIHHQATLVMFTMELHRRCLFYILCVIAPMMLTTFITSLAFLMPPNSGEISFLVTVFVTEALFLNFIAGTMPRSMSETPRLPLFLGTTNFQCLLAMIATVFVIRKHDAEQKNNLDHQQSNNQQKCDDELPISELAATKTSEPQVDFSSSEQSFRKRLAISISGKMPFLKSRITPMDTTRTQSKNGTQQRNQRRTIKATTWSKVFFWLFNVLSICSFIILFMA